MGSNARLFVAPPLTFGQLCNENACLATRPTEGLTEDPSGITVTPMGRRISIKELHRTTGEHVRKAARSNAPITITDHGKPIAILAKPALFVRGPRRRTLLAEYKALLSRKTSGSVLDDLDVIRGDR